MINIRVKKTIEGAEIPAYAADGNVGMDVKGVTCTYDEKYDFYEYSTGIICESGREIGWFVFPNSRISKYECYLCNHVGVIDSFIYRGEIKLRFKNRVSLEQMIQNEVNYRLINSLCRGERPNYSEVYEAVRMDYLNRAKNLALAPFKVGDTIGQLIALRCEEVKLDTEGVINMNTVRGDGAFGSTEKKNDGGKKK